MIWPSQRLDTSSRYIVALRNLRNKQGGLVIPSKAFISFRYIVGTYKHPCTVRNLSAVVILLNRDKIPSGDPDVEERKELFEDIFARLEVVGELHVHGL